VKKNIEISEVFTIDTDENRCALLFCLQLQHQLDDAKMLFLTANNFELVHDNLERIKPYLPYFDALHARTRHLFLKDSWLTLQEQYGARALSNELSSLVEHTSYDLFFLHRIDLFFDKVFTSELEDVMIAFIKDIRYHHKKVIFSYNSKTVTGKAFEELLDKRRDISYHIEDDQHDVEGNCYSVIKTYNKFLKKQYAEICLISDKEEIIKMHETLFAKEENIHFKYATLEEVRNGTFKIDETTDIVIYSEKDKDLTAHVIQEIKEHAHFAKIFYLSDKKFLRKTDKADANADGIDYIAALNFDIVEYVSSIESVIENDFYSQKLKRFLALKLPQEVDFEGLKERVKTLKEEGIIFSLLSVEMDALAVVDIASLIREDDYIYHDKVEDSMVFVLLNILGSSAHEVLSKRLKIKKRAVRLYHDIVLD
jgi:hypothetical protein